jgi:hypothetical protein
VLLQSQHLISRAIITCVDVCVHANRFNKTSKTLQDMIPFLQFFNDLQRHSMVISPASFAQGSKNCEGRFWTRWRTRCIAWAPKSWHGRSAVKLEAEDPRFEMGSIPLTFWLLYISLDYNDYTMDCKMDISLQFPMMLLTCSAKCGYSNKSNSSSTSLLQRISYSLSSPVLTESQRNSWWDCAPGGCWILVFPLTMKGYGSCPSG